MRVYLPDTRLVFFPFHIDSLTTSSFTPSYFSLYSFTASPLSPLIPSSFPTLAFTSSSAAAFVYLLFLVSFFCLFALLFVSVVEIFKVRVTVCCLCGSQHQYLAIVRHIPDSWFYILKYIMYLWCEVTVGVHHSVWHAQSIFASDWRLQTNKLETRVKYRL